MPDFMTAQAALVAIVTLALGAFVGVLIERRGLHRARGRLEKEGQGILEAAKQRT